MPDALKILMVAARTFPFAGGIETHVHEAGRRMVAMGHSVDVLTTDPSGALPPQELVAGMNVHRVRAWPKTRDWHFAPGILSRMKAGIWDVAHIQGYHTFSAPMGIAGAIRGRTPFVVTFHSGGHSSPTRTAMRGLQMRALRPLMARAHQLIGVSEFEADHFSEGLGISRERFRIVPNGAELPAAQRAVAPDRLAPLIVSLGRLERYKGHHRVIEAFAKMLPSVPNARLRLLGDGPFKAELLALAEQHRIADRVEIGGIPARDRQGMAEILASASLVVLLSDYEAHPVAVMEALSMGLRVVTTDTSGFRELARNGLVRAVPLDASPDMTASVMMEEMHTDTKPRVTSLPTWDDCANRLLSIYRDVLSRNRSQDATRAPRELRSANA